MRADPWRMLLPVYLCFLFAFPVGMVWVETRELDGPSICMFRQITHLDCPSCGLTRAFRAMGRLDVMSAFRYNPLGPIIFLGAVAYWIYALVRLVTRGRAQLPWWWQRRQALLTQAAIVVFLLVGGVRIVIELRTPPPPPRPLPVKMIRYFFPLIR